MNPERVRERAADLPREPGVYRFLDGDGHPLYVGKAVDVRDRVRSYADPRSARIRQMLDRARDVDVAVTETESQALLLEANLIKRHNPRYNVRLKDDKSYPVVALTDHEFPRIEVTRDPPEGATVFGPFTTVGTVETVVKALREVYGVRGCSDHKFAGRERPCLDYDIGLCSAPCTAEISRESYREDVESVERFFAGETGILAEPLRRAMETAAENRQFERAANLRDSLTAVERFHEAGDAAVQAATDEYRRTDVLGVSLAGEPCVALFRAEDGKLLDRERHPIALPEGEDQRTEAGEVLGAFIPQYYADRDLPDLLLCPERPVGEGLDTWLGEAGVECRVPSSGRERTLISLAMKNASRYRGEGDASAALAEALGLEAARRVEGFDVSHAQGRAAVGSNVTFEDGSPDKSGYRRKKLEDTNDDYANMRQLVRWRAERALAGRDDRPDPDLLLVDGGQSQVAAASEALSETGWQVPVVGLAKAEERVVTPDGPLGWPDDAPHLQLLRRVRDEAHRFAVAYHQTVRDEVATPLDDVPGVGPELRKRLLRRFGGVDGVREASTAELQDVAGVGGATADRIATHLS